MQPFYPNSFYVMEENKFLGTVEVNKIVIDVYLYPDTVGINDCIIMVHGDREWEYVSYNRIELMPDHFNGTNSYEIAKHFLSMYDSLKLN